MSGTGLTICILLGIIIFAVLAAVICYDSRRFVKVEYTVCSDKLKKNFDIVVLADLHNKSYGEKNSELLKAVEALSPDMIVIAGDMLTADGKHTAYDVPLALLQRLAEKYPVYYANGNHEYRLKVYPEDYGNMYAEYRKKLLECGVHMLENERVRLQDYNLEICGLEIERRYYRRLHLRPMEENYVESILGISRRDCFELLIAHNPDYFERYAGWGADLTLSGHVHGGVIRLPVVGGVISPMLHLFPRYDGGLFEKNGHLMVLSRGLGMHTVPVRVFNPGELVVVHMKTP